MSIEILREMVQMASDCEEREFVFSDEEIQIGLGSQLPPDILTLAQAYPDGAFRTEKGTTILDLVTPCSRNFFYRINKYRNMLSDMRVYGAEVCDYSLYKVNQLGLLPIGTGEQNRYWGWQTKEVTSEWEIFVITPEETIEIFSCSIIRFLSDLFSGKLENFDQVWNGKWFSEQQIKFVSRPQITEELFPLLHQAASGGNHQKVLELIEQDHDLNQIDSNGMSPLLHAILHGDTETLRILLKFGAEIRQRPNSAPPLHFAVENFNAPDNLRLLIEFGSDIDARNQNGATPLMHAISYNNTPAVESLIALGADVNAVDEDGDSTLFYARNKPKYIELLVTGGASAN